MSPGKHDDHIFLFSVRTKILLVFLALSVIALIITGFLAFSQMDEASRFAVDRSTDLGNKASDSSTKALESDAQDSLLRLAKDQAYISNILFEQVKGDINIMAYYASEIQNHPEMIREGRHYTQNETPGDRFSTPLLFYAPGTEKVVAPEEVNAAGMMNQIFIPVYSADHRISAVYVGTDSGIAFIYPWTSGLDSSFDIRQRSWFSDAKKNGGITWSKPYVDMLGQGLMITCSRPVYDSLTGQTWVIGADVLIQSTRTSSAHR